MHNECAVFMCVCVTVCLAVNQGGTNRNHCIQTACINLLMNPDQKLKTRSTWPTLPGFYFVMDKTRMSIICASYWAVVKKICTPAASDMDAPSDRFTPQCDLFYEGNCGGTNHNPFTQTFKILRVQTLLLHLHHKPKTKSIWPTLWFRIACRNEVGMNRHFQANCAPQPIGCLFCQKLRILDHKDLRVEKVLHNFNLIA